MSRTGTARERHLAQSLSGRRNGKRLGLSSVLFRPITLISLILIGCFAFGALIVLGGFAKDLRKAPPGQATPRSVSAVGYMALTEYLDRLGYDVGETRGKRDYYDRESRLVVYSPARPTGRLKRKLETEQDEVSLIILPKWSVTQMVPQDGEEGRTGWARKTSGTGVYYPSSYHRMLDDIPVIRREKSPSPNAKVSFQLETARNLSEKHEPDFKKLQYFDLTTYWPDFESELLEIRRVEMEEKRKKRAEERGEKYEPKERKKDKKKKAADEEDGNSDEGANATEKVEEVEEPEPLPNPEVLLEIDGRPVLIRLEETQTYVLSEPDLLSTMAFQTQGGAQLAAAIIDEIVLNNGYVETQTVDFDVSLHGIEANRNVVKLMVTPPFLAATLCLLAAGGLVAWQGFNRFGDPARLRPDYAQGPVSLAKTAAEFMGIANRAHRTGEDYAQLIRRQVSAHLGYKTRSTEHIDTLLDTREKRLRIQPTFKDLERAIAGSDTQSYGQYARALTTWRNAMTENELSIDHKDS